MTALLRVFFDICLLRQGPQDLPAAQALLWISLLAHAIGSLVLASISLSGEAAMLSALVESLLMVTLSYVLLAVNNRRARWLQTLTALAGTNVILVMFALPLMVWWQSLRAANLDQVIPALLILGLVIWNLMILAHIFRHALSSRFGLGMFTAIGYYCLSAVIIQLLVPMETV